MRDDRAFYQCEDCGSPCRIPKREDGAGNLGDYHPYCRRCWNGGLEPGFAFEGIDRGVLPPDEPIRWNTAPTMPITESMIALGDIRPVARNPILDAGHRRRVLEDVSQIIEDGMVRMAEAPTRPRTAVAPPLLYDELARGRGYTGCTCMVGHDRDCIVHGSEGG